MTTKYETISNISKETVNNLDMLAKSFYKGEQKDGYEIAKAIVYISCRALLKKDISANLEKMCTSYMRYVTSMEDTNTVLQGADIVSTVFLSLYDSDETTFFKNGCRCVWQTLTKAHRETEKCVSLYVDDYDDSTEIKLPRWATYGGISTISEYEKAEEYLQLMDLTDGQYRVLLTLIRFHGNRTKTAEYLGISRNTVITHINRLATANHDFLDTLKNTKEQNDIININELMQ